MTESTGCITTHPLDKHGFENAGTGGTLVANTLTKVVGPDGKMVGVNEKGEVRMHFFIRSFLEKSRKISTDHLSL